MTSYAKARISNPSRYFEAPDRVLADDKLSHDEKEKVLKSMAVDTEQMAEATSEGMVGKRPAFSAKEIQAALKQLRKDAAGNNSRSVRFRRVVVVTTVNQDLNREIADVAFDLAEIAGGKVSLLSVVPPTVEGAGLAGAHMAAAVVPLAADNGQIIKDRKDQLSKLKLEIGANIETEIEVRCGQVEETILSYADDCDADVIVIGSPNRSWLEAIFNPSNVRGVIRSAPCPVLVVPEPA